MRVLTLQGCRSTQQERSKYIEEDLMTFGDVSSAGGSVAERFNGQLAERSPYKFNDL